VTLFDPAPLTSSGQETRFTLPLEVDQPYLRDHQPGGHPLFSTVMGLEAIVAAARRVRASNAPALLEDIRVFEPYIAQGDGPHVVELLIEHSSQTPDSELDCTVLSRLADGTECHHVHSRVTFPADASRVARRPPMTNPARRTSPASVYDLFFHGPSFQVVAGVRFHQGQMICRLRQPLPPSHRDRPGDSETAPRLIEFGLQCAGLLELAVSGRMMIPHSIARIERFSALEVDHPGRILSIARFAPGAPSSIDIDIFDERGRLVLRIDQYRTEPLPFGVDQAAAARLRAELLRSERNTISPL
jgi:hypothetical protein